MEQVSDRPCRHSWRHSATPWGSRHESRLCRPQARSTPTDLGRQESSDIGLEACHAGRPTGGKPEEIRFPQDGQRHVNPVEVHAGNQPGRPSLTRFPSGSLARVGVLQANMGHSCREKAVPIARCASRSRNFSFTWSVDLSSLLREQATLSRAECEQFAGHIVQPCSDQEDHVLREAWCHGVWSHADFAGAQ